jgi:hypothetical protein
MRNPLKINDIYGSRKNPKNDPLGNHRNPLMINDLQRKNSVVPPLIVCGTTKIPIAGKEVPRGSLRCTPYGGNRLEPPSRLIIA